MSATTIVLDDLDSITLAELEDTAAFLTRTDRKYVVPRKSVPAILSRVSPATRVLQIGHSRAFRYESVYFDTPGLRTYLDAVRSRPIRFKVRTRTYRDSGVCMLEVKIRDRRGATHKSRMQYTETSLLETTGREFVSGFDLIAPVADALQPTLQTVFLRRTLALPDSGGRMTVDTDLECALPNGTRFAVPELAIIETKSPGEATIIDRQLWSHHLRPMPMSKFGVGLAALRPQLPSNKWHKTLKVITQSRCGR